MIRFVGKRSNCMIMMAREQDFLRGVNWVRAFPVQRRRSPAKSYYTLQEILREVSSTLREIRSDISNLDISIRDLKRTAEKESVVLKHSIPFERR